MTNLSLSRTRYNLCSSDDFAAQKDKPPSFCLKVLLRLDVTLEEAIQRG